MPVRRRGLAHSTVVGSGSSRLAHACPQTSHVLQLTILFRGLLVQPLPRSQFFAGVPRCPRPIDLYYLFRDCVAAPIDVFGFPHCVSGSVRRSRDGRLRVSQQTTVGVRQLHCVPVGTSHLGRQLPVAVGCVFDWIHPCGLVLELHFLLGGSLPRLLLEHS